MTTYNVMNAAEKAALDKAMAEAPAKLRALKTFETKGDPIVKYTDATKTMAYIQVKVTGASKNYAQTSQNYLKGECEGNGNAATDTFKAMWKNAAQGMTTDEASRWIGKAAYEAILTAAGVDIDNAPATVKTNAENDVDLLIELDPKRVEFEKALQAKAAAIVPRYLRAVRTQQVITSMAKPQLNFVDLKSFTTVTTTEEKRTDADKKVTTVQKEVETISPAALKEKLEYEKRISAQYAALEYLHNFSDKALKSAGTPEEVKAKIEEIKADMPLTEGAVKANEEAEAKAEKAQKRADSKANSDQVLKESIVKSFEMGVPMEAITMLSKVSKAKAEEILTAAGYDPAKPYSEQAKAE